MFLKDIVGELRDNDELIAFFDVLPEFEKDAENDIIVRFKDGSKFRIIAKGSEQRVRGLKWEGKRPDLIVCDDLENDEIVMNEERRKKLKSWFLDALLPCRSDSGIIRVVGTILHLDSLLENLMPPLHDRKTTVIEPLRSYSTNKRSPWKGIRYRAHPGINDFSKILWESKWPEERLRSERQKYIDAGTPEGYAKEYLNYPIDESHAYFRKSDFLPMTENDKEKFKNYYVGIDLALGETNRSDFSALVVAGMDQDGFLHVVDVVQERMDTKEMVERMFTLQARYDPEAFIIEDGVIQKSLGPFLYAEMLKPNRVPLSIVTKKPSLDKEFRARSIQARMRAGGVRFNKEADWYPGFERELLEFPRSRHDDMVDAFAYIGLFIKDLVEAPTKDELKKAEWEEEVSLYLHGNDNRLEQGRSQITGY